MTGSFEALIPRDLRAEVPERIVRFRQGCGNHGSSA
jgi:hypothetical protein